jgi:hypothetical protein
MNRSGAGRRNAGAPLTGMLCLAVVTGVLAPTAARAAENVSSSYNVSCAQHRDAGYPDGTAFADSAEPEGVAYDGERTDASAVPVDKTVTAGSTAVYRSDSRLSGEDCDAAARFRDRLTVGAGSSGLGAGSTVAGEVTIRLDAGLDMAWAGGSFQTRAWYGATAALVSLDDCAPGPEGVRCDAPARFGANHEHGASRDSDGELVTQAERSSFFTTNAGTDLSEWSNEDGDPDPTDPQVFTAPVTLTVGGQYDLTASVNVFSQAYDQGGARGAATVDELSFALTAEGVDLVWASGGVSPEPDGIAPSVSADVSPAAVGGWHTAAPTIAFAASDAASGVASITYASTGAFVTEETVIEGEATELVIGTDGVTEVTYQATDGAGNVSEPQSLTIRLDRGAPRLLGVQDVTVVAANGKEAAPTWSVTGEDDQGEPVAVTCDPASGAALPVGATEVTCVATDAAGNTASAAFTVTVTVPRPPVLHLPGPIVVDATAPGGAGVTYTATATDDGAVPPLVSCVPPSGGNFPIGTTTVACTATDDMGLTNTGRFTVTVRGAAAQLGELLRDVTGITPRGNIRAILAAIGRVADPILPLIACQPLATAAQLLQGPNAKQLPSDAAARWLADVLRIRAVLGCSSGKVGSPVK